MTQPLPFDPQPSPRRRPQCWRSGLTLSLALALGTLGTPALANEPQAAGGLQVVERSNLKAVLSEQAETTDDVAIDIHVVDSTTGEMMGFRTVEGTDTSTAESRQRGVNLLPAAGLTIFGVPMSRGGQTLVGAAVAQRRRSVLDLD